MMLFQPTVKDFVIAHPLPLFLFWLPGAIWIATRISPNWDSTPPEGQLAVVAMFALWGIPTLLSLPKVWWHLWQKRKHKLAGIDPELLSQQRKRRLNIALSLLAVATFEYVTYFLNSHSSAENPPQYMTAVGVFGSLSLLPFILFYRSSRSWGSYIWLAVICALGVAGLWQLSNPVQLLDTYPDLTELLVTYPALSFYLFITAMLCAVVPPLVVLVTMLLRAASWLRVRGAKPVTIPETTFIVTWCLPVPKRTTASATAVQLPDYCKQILASSRKVAA